jgi:hypothetical protein
LYLNTLIFFFFFNYNEHVSYKYIFNYICSHFEKEEIYNFDCVESIDIMKVETISTVRGATRIWNMTIQYWIAEYVYRRFPIKNFR